MNEYRIFNKTSGANLGVFEGESPEEAIEAMARDSGYDSQEACAEALGESVETLKPTLSSSS